MDNKSYKLTKSNINSAPAYCAMKSVNNWITRQTTGDDSGFTQTERLTSIGRVNVNDSNDSNYTNDTSKCLDPNIYTSNT